MQSFLYGMNVATMAIWTSVTAMGVVGLTGSGDPGRPARPAPRIVTMDNVGEGPLLDLEPESGSPAPGPSDPEEAADPQTPQTEEIPTPPEFQVTDVEAPPELPEMPDLPPRPVTPTPSPVPSNPKPASATPPRSSAPRNPGATSANRGQPGSGAGNGNGKGTGTGNGDAPGNGKAGGEGARLKKGNFVRPVYPPSCKAANQTGTVIVVFTVDASGKVVNVRVTKPSPYAAMNEAAVNAAYRWSFPAGSGSASGSKAINFTITD